MSNNVALPGQGEIASAAPALTPAKLPPFKVSGLFGSHMILQQGRPITVHGWSAHLGQTVTGSWDGAETQAKVDETGRFALTFPAHPIDFTPTTMTITAESGESVTFTDILVGDVWVIGGQSNAELNLAPCLSKTPDLAENISEADPIRLFAQTQAGAAAHTEFHNTPSPDIIDPNWCWKRPDLEAAKSFSALGYYFARELMDKIDRPIGLVMMCAGGACLRELMPAELAHRLGYTTGANVPVAGYYNTLIAPLIGLQFAGQIFFQGESEGIWKEMALSYHTDLAEFVADERARFGQDFPFYNVQLCSYRSEGGQYFPHLHWVRSRQLMAAAIIPDYHLIVSRDLGARDSDPDFAHSYYKAELARRTALSVLAHHYGQGDPTLVSSPAPTAWEHHEDHIVLIFANTGDGLTAADGSTGITGFAFQTADEAIHPAAAAVIAPDRVQIQVPAGCEEALLLYAMEPLAGIEQANLANLAGFPAPAFVLNV